MLLCVWLAQSNDDDICNEKNTSGYAGIVKYSLILWCDAMNIMNLVIFSITAQTVEFY